MAFPLKSGADLYNQQLIRAAIWNYSAEIIDPKEYATGLMYFNTNPGSNLYQKLRFRTGTEWKTIAFEEDLDVANNADFQKLKDKVDLLSGDVDTDAIINNMKDVENFLAGFNESGGTLMNYLNTELGKKLDLSGGIITRSDRNQLCLTNSEGGAATLWFNNDFNYRVGGALIQHEKDTGAFFFTNMTTYAESGSTALAGINIPKEGGIFVTNATLTTKYPILHSGNVGEYNAGGLVTIDSRNQNFAPYANDFMKKALTSHFERALSVGYGATDYYMSILHISPWLNTSGGPEHQLAFRADGAIGHRYGDTSWSDWKTIAFTDSNVASAQALVHSNGTVGAVVNSSGNVTIGASDLAGTDYKLYVNGAATFVGNRVTIPTNGDRVTFNAASGYTMGVLAMNTSNTYIEAPLATNSSSGEKTPILIGWRNGTYPFVILPSGNIGIGITNPLHKLHVAGDIVANGTIACKGVAAEGSEVGMGTVDKKVLSIPSSTTQQTFSLTHGLNTREITVCIYEVTNTGTNMILTDVEITGDNTISVSFGNPPTENHMVVVMG